MAKISLSPLVVDIRGKQKDTVFSKWRGLNYIRSRVTPGNPKTEAQTLIREALAMLVAIWSNTSTDIKLNRNKYASGKNFSGFNSYVGDNCVKERDEELTLFMRDNGYDQLETFNVFQGSGSGEIRVEFAPSPIPAGQELVVICKLIKDPNLIYPNAFGEGTESSQVISGFENTEQYQVNGYLRKAGATKGDEIGADSVDSCVSGPMAP